LKSVLTSKLLYGGLYFAPQKVATGLALSPIAYATREIQELGELLYKSKHAQKYYKDAMKSALEGNKTAFAHSAARLDKVVQKYEQENENIQTIIRTSNNNVSFTIPPTGLF